MVYNILYNILFFISFNYCFSLHFSQKKLNNKINENKNKICIISSKNKTSFCENNTNFYLSGFLLVLFPIPGSYYVSFFCHMLKVTFCCRYRTNLSIRILTSCKPATNVKLNLRFEITS